MSRVKAAAKIKQPREDLARIPSLLLLQSASSWQCRSVVCCMIVRQNITSQSWLLMQNISPSFGKKNSTG